MDAPQAADKLAVLNAVDTLSGLRAALREIAAQRNEWAGIPMVLENLPIRIEPTYPLAKELMEIASGKFPREAGPDEASIERCQVINSWWSSRKGGDVVLFREGEGPIEYGVDRQPHSLTMQFQTLLAADVWGIEQEARAIQLLGTMLPHRLFKHYLLTGMFMEESKRSGVHYIFRRLRPTVAFKAGCGRPWIHKDKEGLRILACLCLHPIGYYEGSWAGAMCPTDDVIAALVMMRSDEPMLWKRANQIPAYRPNAGL